MKVLVIDDEVLVRGFVKCVLERQGYEVSLAEDGIQGLEVYHQKEFDLVITDVYMPRLSGIQLVEKILALRPAQKILMMSGNLMSKDEITWLSQRKIYFIDKPFGIEKFLSFIEKICGV